MEDDKEISKYIYSILLLNPTILMSWGFTSPIAIKMGLKFSVSGFLLKGTVQIIYNGGSDLFDLTFNNVDGTVRNSLEGIFFDELVNVIDEQVERVENYIDRVKNEYNN